MLQFPCPIGIDKTLHNELRLINKLLLLLLFYRIELELIPTELLLQTELLKKKKKDCKKSKHLTRSPAKVAKPKAQQPKQFLKVILSSQKAAQVTQILRPFKQAWAQQAFQNSVRKSMRLPKKKKAQK